MLIVPTQLAQILDIIQKIFIRCYIIFLAPLIYSLNLMALPNTPYTEVKNYLYQLAKNHPDNARVFVVGNSNENEAILGLEIGTGETHNLVVATHHGNEYGSTEVAKAIAGELAQNPIADQTVYVIPVLNISGYNQGRRNELSFDPNRDYPGPCGTPEPFRLNSTKSLAQFIEKKNIISSATLHTYYPAVVYPWGFSTHDTWTPYESLYKNLAHYATLESGYQIGNSTEVIYPADGTYEDFVFWKLGVWSLLFELGYSHSPDPEAVFKMIQANVPGIRRYLENAPKQRAEDHEFRGNCDAHLKSLDRHDE